MVRPAEHLVFGLDAPVVVVSGRVAAWLLSRAGLDHYHRCHRGDDPEVDQALVALKLAAAAWQATVADHGKHHPHRVDSPHSAVSGLSTTQAARRLGCSPRTVRWAIAAGRLPAERIGAGWVLDPIEVEHYRARRAAA